MAIRTPMKAIRAKCLECSCGQMSEVRNCTVKTCPLWEYRSGHRPKNIEPRTEKEDLNYSDDDFIV